MEECELCGRQLKDVYVIDVENVEMRVCAACAKGKRVLRTEMEKPAQRRGSPGPAPMPQRPAREEDMALIEGYGGAIRNARERMKLPIKVLAEMINEKEHYLQRVEEEKTEPTMALTKKLEKALSIKLTEEPHEEGRVQTRRATEATLGEFVKEE